jgi:1-acyl-sn-glycerol-3-phosphate acyltransferase
MNRADANFPPRRWSEALIGAFLGAIWGVKVTGLENVPLDGPLIIASNHASNLDGLLMAVAVAPRRRPFGIGKKELFAVPVLGWFLRETGCFPLDRTGDARGALKTALDVLERGGCLYIAPEGTRVKPGDAPRAPKAGVSFLSRHGRAPVVPLRLVGTGEFPRRFPLEVRIGSPLPSPESDDRERGLAYAKDLMERIYSL